LDESLNGQEVLVRGRLHASRATGKNCFITVREQFSTIQAIVGQSDTVSKGMVKYAGKIPKESIIDIKATVIVPEKTVDSCTQKVELSIKEIWIVNKSVPQLPFQIDDAGRRCENQADEEKAENIEKKGEEAKFSLVGQDVRLNNRIIDLRVPANQALMRIQSAVGMLFREFLYKQDFVEIHSPKLIGGTSEGGANVFRLNYFD
jgi:aspartyl-tRNA synthetase